MEDERIIISSEWRTKLDDVKYKNWLKVGYAIHLACEGIRPYVEREAKLFHSILLTKGIAACTCIHVPRRRPSPYHDMANCDWAKELNRHHTKRKPTWSHSDCSKWTDPNVGFWEVAKVYMPFGCASGKINANETDATGLLNFLQFCSHFKTNVHFVEELKNTRNKWAHEAQQEFSKAQTDDAFKAIKDLLQDPELISDMDAQEALVKVDEIENAGDLLDFEDVETKIVTILKSSIESAKEELKIDLKTIQDQEDSNAQDIKEKISHLTELLKFCLMADRERDDTLQNMETQFQQMLDHIQEISNQRNQTAAQRYLMAFSRISAAMCWTVLMHVLALYLMLPKIASRRRVIIAICLMAQITILEENVEDIGKRKILFLLLF